ncbi:MAG: hypothetical protein WCI95_01390 [bacterium]
MKPKRTFGNKIAEARTRVTPGLSRRELAQRLLVAGIDMDAGVVAEIEAGERHLNYYQVVVIASALKTSTFSLYGQLSGEAK